MSCHPDCTLPSTHLGDCMGLEELAHSTTWAKTPPTVHMRITPETLHLPRPPVTTPNREPTE